MREKFCALILAAAFPAAALAQAPAAPAPPVGSTVSPGGATTTIIDQERRDGTAQAPSQRSAGTRPGTAPLPMNIKIQDSGIKLPACTAESREGEACKK